MASRVKLAAQAAGGASALTSAIHSALTLSDSPVDDPPELAAIAADLDRLAKGGVIEGEAVESLEARQREILGELAAIRSLGGRRRRQRAIELMQDALAGSEAARAELGRLAVMVPRAFPTGFAEVVAEARYDRAVIAELTAALAA